jgi:hypothetical protein
MLTVKQIMDKHRANKKVNHFFYIINYIMACIKINRFFYNLTYGSMRLARHIALIEEVGNARTSLMRKFEENRPLVRSRPRWHNINVNNKELVCKEWMGSFFSE